MPICFTIELINAATIRTFDTAVGSNRQKYARVAIPGFVRGAATVQRQVGRSNNDGRLCLVGHGDCPYWAVGVVAGTFGSSQAASVAYYRLDILPCRLMPYDGNVFDWLTDSANITGLYRCLNGRCSMQLWWSTSVLVERLPENRGQSDGLSGNFQVASSCHQPAQQTAAGYGNQHGGQHRQTASRQ